MPTIVFASPKGGVGKSTAAVLLAMELATHGAPVTMIDADPNRPLTQWAGRPGRPAMLSVITAPTEESIIDTIEKAALQTPFVIVDLEGTASMMAGYAMSRADLVIIPAQGSHLDATEAVKAIKLVKGQERAFQKRIPFAVLFTRTSVAIRSGKHVRVAGNVIVRQRPGTAKGIVFLSIEDETGIANAVVMPDIFDANRLLIVSERWSLVEGPIQNVDNVIHVRAKRIEALGFSGACVPSHDFH